MGFGKKRKPSLDELRAEVIENAGDISNSIPDEKFHVETVVTYDEDTPIAIIDLEYSKERETELKELIKKKRKFSDKDLKVSRFGKKPSPKLFELETLESYISAIMIHSNQLKFETDSTRSKNVSTLISGGNFDFGDDFSKGYTLIVSQKERDKPLMKFLAKYLRSQGWGCLYGDLTMHCHLKNESPSSDGTFEHLKKIVKYVKNELDTNGLPISVKS
ncbi:hypothetical protein OAJ55_00390 [Candidatus Nitrosopelagicus sp.]|nr:hypothetical protein [Candidatus Nitrosopelagicus sp.]